MSAGRKALSVAAARDIDRDAHERLGMPTSLLMENAARSVAEVAGGLGARFVVLCGAGNNGGDGLAVARHLGHARCAIHMLAEPDPQDAIATHVEARFVVWDAIRIPKARVGLVLNQ